MPAAQAPQPTSQQHPHSHFGNSPSLSESCHEQPSHRVDKERSACQKRRGHLSQVLQMSQSEVVHTLASKQLTVIRTYKQPPHRARKENESAHLKRQEIFRKHFTPPIQNFPSNVLESVQQEENLPRAAT